MKFLVRTGIARSSSQTQAFCLKQTQAFCLKSQAAASRPNATTRSVTWKTIGLNSRHLQAARLYQSIAVKRPKRRPFIATPRHIMDVSSDRVDYRIAIGEIVTCARQCYGWIVPYFPRSRVDRHCGHSADGSCCRDSEKRMLNLVAHSASLVARLVEARSWVGCR
jgi:hypothetical protein